MGSTVVTKQCTQCGLTKSIHDFYRNSSSPDGYRSACKICHNVSRGKSGTDGTDGTVIEKPIINNDSSPMNSQSSPPGTNKDVPGGFGTEFILTIPSFDYTMQDVDMCPVCNDYDVRFNCMLENGNIKIPFLCCNSCILKVGSKLIKFYKQDEMMYVVRSVKVDSL